GPGTAHVGRHPRPDQHPGPDQPDDRPVRGPAPCRPLPELTVALGAADPPGYGAAAAGHLRPRLPGRAEALRQGAAVRAQISVRGVGIRFVTDRQHRPVTPLMERTRSQCQARWVLRGVDLDVEPGSALALD